MLLRDQSVSMSKNESYRIEKHCTVVAMKLVFVLKYLLLACMYV